MKYKNNLGKYPSVDAVWTAYPSGGSDGDYCIVDGMIHYWDENEKKWLVPATTPSSSRKTEIVYGDMDVHHNLSVGGVLSAKVVRGRNAFCGLFADEASLNRYVPKPYVGQWALCLVDESRDDNAIGEVYLCDVPGLWRDAGFRGGFDGIMDVLFGERDARITNDNALLEMIAHNDARIELLKDALKDYYTKDEIDELLHIIGEFGVEVPWVYADALPAPSKETTNKLYFVPSEQPNVKDEYITVLEDGEYVWKKVGSTSVDMSGFCTTDEMIQTVNRTVSEAIEAERNIVVPVTIVNGYTVNDEGTFTNEQLEEWFGSTSDFDPTEHKFEILLQKGNNRTTDILMLASYRATVLPIGTGHSLYSKNGDEIVTVNWRVYNGEYIGGWSYSKLGTVSTNTRQELTPEQQQQARENVDAQKTLVSGTNIKTINHQSILGEGNINIEGIIGPQGPKGDKGDPGRDGVDGRDGIDGQDGRDGRDGRDGVDGQDGQDGRDGTSVRVLPTAADCVSVGDGYIDSNGHLMTLSSLSPRTFTDCGEIKGPKGDPGDDYVLTNQDKEDIAALTKAVSYDTQTLTDVQKITAINNIQGKEYSSSAANHSGMGKVYLAKNGGTLIQDMLYRGAAGSRVPSTNTVFVIQYDYSLGNGSITIPAGCVLEFDGGSFSNGTIVGNNTSIIAKDVMIFNSVTISGTWVVPTITTKWFNCVNDNDLVQAFNLLSDTIQNTITVEDKGSDYWVDCQVGGSLANPVGILNLKSNTRCVVNGTIRQRGHGTNFIHLFLLYRVENVVLEGSGVIHGEKMLHDYSSVTPILPTDDDYNKNTHENNHVINIQKCKNVTVNGLTLLDSTGDGIDILNHNENVDNHIVIENFTIDNCSRQGISAEGSYIEIKNGTISNVNRTMPMSGIDIEISGDGRSRTAHDISVQDVTIFNCYTGLQSYTSDSTPADIHDLKFYNVKCGNVNRGFYFHDNIYNVSVDSCVFEIIPCGDNLTLTYSPSDNFELINSKVICDYDECREHWGWDSEEPANNESEESEVVENESEEEESWDPVTVHHDFSLLRTGAFISALRTVNKSYIRNCVLYSPYTNLHKRPNYNTTIENCTITCLYLNCTTTAINSILRNSTITVLGTEERGSGYAAYFDGWSIENNEIEIGAPIRFYNASIRKNNIIFTAAAVTNSEDGSGTVYYGYFIAINASEAKINLVDNVITQRGNALLSAIFDTSSKPYNSSACQFYGNKFTNQFPLFNTIPVEYRGAQTGKSVVESGNIYCKFISNTVATDDNQTLTDTQKNTAINNISGRAYSATAADHSGLGRIYLPKNDGTLSQTMMNTPNTVYVIQYDYTLFPNVTVPANCTLEFQGGSLSGRQLTGNNTRIIADKRGIFENIVIAGTWNVPEIYSEWFKDATSNNVLKQLMNLASNDIHNDIYIAAGTYALSALSDTAEKVFNVNKETTDIYCCGELSLSPNSYYGYSVVALSADNTSFHGGAVKGDAVGHNYSTHQSDEYSTHEWGYGIAIEGANCKVDGTVISHCTGDGICVRGDSGNSTVKNITIFKCRRQGITLGTTSFVDISNFDISNIGSFTEDGTSVTGTNPMSAIDIEPNTGRDPAHHITIKNGIMSYCRLGLQINRTSSSDEGNYLISVENVIANDISYLGCYIKNAGAVSFKRVSIGNIRLEATDDFLAEDSYFEQIGFNEANRNAKIVSCSFGQLYLRGDIDVDVSKSNLSDVSINGGTVGLRMEDSVIDTSSETPINIISNENAANVGLVIRHTRIYHRMQNATDGVIFIRKNIKMCHFEHCDFYTDSSTENAVSLYPTTIKDTIFKDVYLYRKVNGEYVKRQFTITYDNSYQDDVQVLCTNKEYLAGTTRPSLTKYSIGHVFLDLTLGKPVFWTGDTANSQSGWVDATGAYV